MAQCQGKTKKGAQCKREAAAGGAFCSIHIDQAVRERKPPSPDEWDTDAILKAAIGVALVGALFLFRFRR